MEEKCFTQRAEDSWDSCRVGLLLMVHLERQGLPCTFCPVHSRLASLQAAYGFPYLCRRARTVGRQLSAESLPRQPGPCIAIFSAHNRQRENSCAPQAGLNWPFPHCSILTFTGPPHHATLGNSFESKPPSHYDIDETGGRPRGPARLVQGHIALELPGADPNWSTHCRKPTSPKSALRLTFYPRVCDHCRKIEKIPSCHWPDAAGGFCCIIFRALMPI